MAALTFSLTIDLPPRIAPDQAGDEPLDMIGEMFRKEFTEPRVWFGDDPCEPEPGDWMTM